MLKLGTPGQFRTVRNFLQARFTEEIVAAALAVPSMMDFDKRDPHKPIRDLLVRLFFGGAAVPMGDFHSAVPANVSDAMSALGLIAPGGDSIWCPVILYPTQDLFLVSDRFTLPDGKTIGGDREFVYFALTLNTQHFLEMLPGTPCGSFLDIGAGCGAAALVQARVAQRSVASDICPRSTLFARFNALLNDVGNAEVVQGSMYAPVEGRTFDRIACHPPYDISVTTPWTFADGGDDGEFVIRGTITGLPDHLTPGGRFFALFRGADRTGKPLEHRVREWLGERNEEFDIAIVVRGLVELRDYTLASILSTTKDLELYDKFMNRFAELQVEQLVYCNVLIRRKQDRSAPVTVRRELGARCTSVELEWLLNWELAAPGFDLADVVLRMSPAAELIVHHRVVHGDLRPQEYNLRTDLPFRDEVACPEWIAVLVSGCSEPKPAGKLYEEMREQAPIDPEQFAGAVKRLISSGVLQLASGSSMTSSS